MLQELVECLLPSAKRYEHMDKTWEIFEKRLNPGKLSHPRPGLILSTLSAGSAPRMGECGGGPQKQVGEQELMGQRLLGSLKGWSKERVHRGKAARQRWGSVPGEGLRTFRRTLLCRRVARLSN